MAASRVLRRITLLSILCTLLGTTACQGAPEPLLKTGQLDQAIIDGIPEPGQPGVVLIYNSQVGAMCTATVIGSRVLLTARHCVRYNEGLGSLYPVAGWGVYVGQTPNMYTPKYGIEEVRTSGGTEVYDNDIAVMIVAGVMDETPYPVVTTLGADFIGDQVYLIGYGVDDCPGGDSGSKNRTTDQVIQFDGQNSFVTLGNGANQGDSGGPVFSLTYEVVGVMVAVDGNCEGYTVCTRVDRFGSLIQQALEDTGGCYPTGPEVCGDQIDNDCNNLVDDGCNAIGEPCTENADCASGLCVDLGLGMLCHQACDPRLYQTTCVAGYYCKEVTCDAGACVPGTPGVAGFGAACNTDTDCSSLYCRLAGDGRQYCGVRCALDQGECLASEVCAPMGETCGACQLSSTYTALRGIGEICQNGSICRSGLCIEDTGALYCSLACASSSGCPDNFHCRDSVCVRGYLGSEGDPCLSTEDCVTSLICHQPPGGGDAYCTEDGCDAVGEQCLMGFECTDIQGLSICVTGKIPVGGRCSSNAECISAGCLEFDDDGICTLPCDRDEPCPPTTYCTYSDSGQLACAPNTLAPVTTPPGTNSGGGGCQTVPGTQAAWWLLLLLGWLLIRLRRR